MEQQALCPDVIESEYNPRFLEFIKLLMLIDTSEKLFPKECRTCGKQFRSLSEYLCTTAPKAHTFENCQAVMRKPFTMVYRHCTCGNTLVLSLTEQNFPQLNEFWTMLEQEAAETGKELLSIVSEFTDECERYMDAWLDALGWERSMCGDNAVPSDLK
jgi:hypothetical protein